MRRAGGRRCFVALPLREAAVGGRQHPTELVEHPLDVLEQPLSLLPQALDVVVELADPRLRLLADRPGVAVGVAQRLLRARLRARDDRLLGLAGALEDR